MSDIKFLSIFLNVDMFKMLVNNLDLLNCAKVLIILLYTFHRLATVVSAEGCFFFAKAEEKSKKQ